VKNDNDDDDEDSVFLEAFLNAKILVPVVVPDIVVVSCMKDNKNIFELPLPPTDKDPSVEAAEKESVLGMVDDVDNNITDDDKIQELLPPPATPPSPLKQVRRSRRIAVMSEPPLLPFLRRSLRLGLIPRVSYVGMC
jgi:hypothetical protein